MEGIMEDKLKKYIAKLQLQIKQLERKLRAEKNKVRELQMSMRNERK